jgi:filamentous hemagglutinin
MTYLNGRIFRVFHGLSFILALSGMLVQPVLVYAQSLPVIAAPNAAPSNTPVVATTASGIPLVLIATPNSAGVSNNLYSQYNVGTQGLILNNAQHTALTQQAGYVTANPNLANGSAKIILNQVNGGSASQLLGYTEVAGTAAQVVIANPSGIYCNGCGFINATRGVLTTGTPVFGGTGSLDAFHVTGGQIQVDSLGLNGSNVDQVDLIARSVKINGQVWAKQQLNAVTGSNQVNYANLSAQPLTPDTNVPAMAIDIALLGGMYANKIMLVGTEAGVGVNSQGTIAAQAGNFTLSSNGQVTLAGTSSANGNVTVNAAGSVTNSSTTYASQNTSITSQGQISNTGTIAALGNTSISASTINSSGSLGAGIDSNGNATGSGNLNVSGTGAVTLTGQNIAAGSIALSGSSLDLKQTKTNASNAVTLIATGVGGDTGNVDGTGAVLNAGGGLTISAAGAVLNNQGQMNAAQMTLSGASLSNRSGSILLTGTGNDALSLSGALDNTQGMLGVNGQGLTLQSASLINLNGQIMHAGTGILSVTTSALTNTSGNIATNGQGSITASSVDNSSGSVTGVTGLSVTASAGDINNTQGTVQSGGTALLSATNINNTAGSIVSTGGGGINLTAAAQVTNNAGTTALGRTGGVIGSNGNASIQAATLSNNGSIQTANNLNVTAGSLSNSGSMGAGALLGASTGTLTNTGSMMGASVSLAATQSLTNEGATAFIGASDVSGKLELLSPIIQNLDNTTATDTQASTTIYGMGQMVLAGGKDSNGNYINATQVLNQSGLIQSGGDMTVDATTVTNTRRVLTTSSTYMASVNPALINSLGVSLSGQTGQINVHNPNLIGGVYIEPPHGGAWNSDYLYTTYTGTALENKITAISPQAQMISGGNLTANVGTLNNSWSQITAAGNISLATGATLNQNSSPLLVQVDYSGYYWYRTYKGGIWTLSFCGTGCNAAADIRYYAIPAYNATLTANGTLSATGATINNVAGGGMSGAASITQSKASAATYLSNLTVPQNGLYTVNTAPSAQYLVNTNPAFTNLNQFLSSNYYFQLMGVNPSQIQKRLGDGFYEQQTVENQVMSLTGRSVFTGYVSTQDEYMALMTSGANLAKSIDLAPGVGLSADQVAQLTSNVVIMQYQVVNGQTVLVPVVYLAQASQQNLGNGPVISAGNVNLTNTVAFNNSGVVSATDAMTVTGASINNKDGRLSSGGQMNLATLGDVNLTGSKVSAGSLNLDAGGNLLLNASTSTVSQTAANGTTSRTTVGPNASITVANDATITTGGDFQQNAGNLNVGGNFTANVGGNYEIGSLQSNQTKSYTGMGGYANSNFNSSVGSNLTVGGTSAIQVGKDLTATGANINLNGGRIQAGGNVNLQAATATSSVDSAYQGSDFSDHLQTSNQTVTGTTLTSGGNLSIAAGKDINVSGSNVNMTGTAPGQGALALNATGNVNIGTATQQDSYSLAGTGRHSGMVDTTAHQSLNVVNTSTAIGSSINSNSVSVTAGNDLNITGSQVKAMKDVSLAANNDINISAGTNTRTEDHYLHQTSTGLQFSNGNLTDSGAEVTQHNTLAATTSSTSQSLIQSNQGNITAVAGNNMVVTGSRLSTSAPATNGGSQATGTGTISLSAGKAIGLLAGQDTLNTSSSTLIITNPNAFTKQQATLDITSSSVHNFGSGLTGNAINMGSGADTVLQGANAQAGTGGININAGGNLQMLAAYDTTRYKSKETLGTDGFAMNMVVGLDGAAARNKNNNTTVQTQTAQVTQLAGLGDITTHSGSDTTLEGTNLNAAGSINLSAGNALVYNTDGSLNTAGTQGNLIINGAMNSVYENVQNSGSSSIWQHSYGSGQDTQTLQLANISAGKGLTANATSGIQIQVAQPKPAAPAAPQYDAKGKLIPPVVLTSEQQAAKNQADLNARIDALASQPGQAWIGQLAKQNNTTFNQVKLAAQNWNYSESGLTAEAAAVVVLVVTYFTAGAASGAAGAMTGAAAGTTTVASVALAAGMTTMASQTAVSLINNKGDIGKTLNDLGQSQHIKALATAMVTAGALQGLNTSLNIGNTSMGNINAQSHFLDQLQKNLIDNTASATINTAINGGNLESNLANSLKTAFIDTGAAQSANGIGNLYTDKTLNDFTHLVAHAIAGCAAGAAQSGDCSSGALGAAVGELSAQLYGGARLNGSNLDIPALQTDTVNFARMMSGIAVAITGGDAASINLAADAGGNAAQNNYLSHWQQAAYEKEMKVCSSAACKIGTSLRWGGTSVKQDAARVTGMALGAGIEVKDAAAALAELPQTITMLANNPELLKGLPDGYVQGLQTTYTDYQTALESAGVDGATAAGVDFTHLLTQLALLPTTVATGGAAAGYTVGKMAGLLGRLGKVEGTVVAGEAAAIADARTATQAVAARSQYSYTRAEEINKNFGSPPWWCPRFCVIGLSFNAAAYAHRT